MKQYLQTNWSSFLFTPSVSYPAIPILLPVSSLSKSQECWLPKFVQSDNNFKSGSRSDKEYHNGIDNIDWGIYDVNDQMSVYNALFVFAECMRSSLEEKLNRNFNTSNEIIYYAMPYWNKLSNDDKKGWIRRAEAEMNARYDIQTDKQRGKIKEEKAANRKASNVNRLCFSALSKEKTSSTSNKPKKHFPKKNFVSFILPHYSIQRKKEQNTLIKIFKSLDRFSGKYMVKDDANKYHNREAGSQDHYYSRKQFIRMSSIVSPLRMEELIWNNDRRSDNHTYC